ncbi:TPA: hypothetical protein HA361_02915 [Candidatus Woesearchaeota archaeon]|nr:hypothetical protein [Candidatus Woesearchaeota archaeon]HII68668.1 hypothetical protein [Candidatus Woesearchaeota archaeon]
MELKVIESKKHRMVFELSGANLGFCNALKDAMQRDESVRLATFGIRHPLISKPEFTIETSSEEAATAAANAAAVLKKQAEKLSKAIAKEI